METDARIGGMKIYEKDGEGLVFFASSAGTPPTTAGVFCVGALVVDTGSNRLYLNTGTTASPAWNSVAEVDVTDIADAVITPAKYTVAVAVTANDDGTGTAVISESATHVTITSAGATKQATLPSGASVGKKLTIWVGANGFELLTPASSNATINTVDSDGTNQVDIPANTLSELTCVATNTWILRSNTALGAVATALIPDND